MTTERTEERRNGRRAPEEEKFQGTKSEEARGKRQHVLRRKASIVIRSKKL